MAGELKSLQVALFVKWKPGKMSTQQLIMHRTPVLVREQRSAAAEEQQARMGGTHKHNPESSIAVVEELGYRGESSLAFILNDRTESFMLLCMRGRVAVVVSHAPTHVPPCAPLIPQPTRIREREIIMHQ